MTETAHAPDEVPKRKAVDRAPDGRLSLVRWAPAILFLTNLFLVYAFFLPNLRDINLWDEAAIVSSGRALLQGQIPSYASSPLASIFYALVTLPFWSSPFWLVQSTSLGRLILFSLLWLGTYLVARQLGRYAPPAVMLGFLFVTPMSLEFLRFPTDPLFASMAAICFSFVLAYRRGGMLKDAGLASLFLGLAALARNDGLILFLVFVPIVVVLSGPLSQWRKSLAAAAGPFVLLVGGYVLVAGLLSGSYGLGTMQRTYDNFESGQQAVFQGSGKTNAVIEARLEARRLFGTPQENDYSVFRAIARNPKAYLARLKAITIALPDTILRAYGIRFAVVLLLLAIRGVIELLRQREHRLLAIMALWPIHLVTGFVITIFRQGHVLLPFYVVFGLAAIGLTAVLASLGQRRETAAWFLALGLIAISTLLTNKLAVFYGVGLLLLALWICTLVRRAMQGSSAWQPLGLLVLLCAGLVLRGGFPSPILPKLGQAADEQAVLYLHDHFAPGTGVAAGAPGAVMMAGMSPATLASTDVPIDRSPKEFVQWMRDQGIKAVYVDPVLTGDNPVIWGLIQQQIGIGLERVFVGDGGDFQVLLVKPAP